MKDKLFVGLDLDYTALDTDRFFYEGVLPAITAAYPAKVQPASFIKAMDSFRRQFGPANDYDFFGHIRSLDLAGDEISDLIVQQVSGDHLLKPGIKAFIAAQQEQGNDLHIVTLGEDRYQRLKVQCLPALANLSVHTVLNNKGTYIRQTFGDRRGYHIDDAEVTDLPPGIAWLQVISRKSKVFLPDAYVSVYTLLEQGPAALKYIPN